MAERMMGRLQSWWAGVDPWQRMEYVWLVIVGVGMYAAMWWGLQHYAAMDTVGDMNFMPAVWLLAGIIAALYVVVGVVLRLRTPVAVLIRVWYGGQHRMAWRSFLLGDARRLVRFVAEAWPAAIALLAFVSLMGVVNLSLYVLETEPAWSNARLQRLVVGTAALTVVNSFALVAVAFHVLNPVPWLTDRVAEALRPTVERVMADE